MMPFKYVFLWTDFLTYLLLLVVALYALRARSREHLGAPWRKVARSRSAMGAAVVLSVYVAIGVLDSIHVRLSLQQKAGEAQQYFSPEVLSVFDIAVGPLRSEVEKTYSAPFATQLYSMETVVSAEGKVVRAYPHLKYGGKHLGLAVGQRVQDITATLIKAAALALLTWLAGSCLLLLWLARRKSAAFATTLNVVLHGKSDMPWRTILLTVGVMLLLGFVATALAGKYHIFGTDKVGNDVFFLSLKSIRTGLVIGTLTTLVMLPFALLLGIMAGYFRGWVDDVIQYLYTTLNSIPDVLLIAAAVLMMQVYMDGHPELFETVSARADLRLLFLCMILGITSWTGLCRLLRGETLKLREADYIQAAGAFGVGHFKIMARHILPNVMHIVLITVTLQFSSLVLAEAVLAYVGVGVDPSMQSWGNMINGARLELAREPMVWWSLLSAFAFMFVLVLCANLFADAVRDAFDPRVK